MVWAIKTPRTTDLIKVDFPDALGPVIKILFGFESPICKSLVIALEGFKNGFQTESEVREGPWVSWRYTGKEYEFGWIRWSCEMELMASMNPTIWRRGTSLSLPFGGDPGVVLLLIRKKVLRILPLSLRM